MPDLFLAGVPVEHPEVEIPVAHVDPSGRLSVPRFEAHPQAVQVSLRYLDASHVRGESVGRRETHGSGRCLDVEIKGGREKGVSDGRFHVSFAEQAGRHVDDGGGCWRHQVRIVGEIGDEPGYLFERQFAGAHGTSRELGVADKAVVHPYGVDAERDRNLAEAHVVATRAGLGTPVEVDVAVDVQVQRVHLDQPDRQGLVTDVLGEIESFDPDRTGAETQPVRSLPQAAEEGCGLQGGGELDRADLHDGVSTLRAKSRSRDGVQAVVEHVVDGIEGQRDP